MSQPLDARVSALIADLDRRYSEQSTLDWIRAIWQSDRWSDYTAFRRTAEYCAEELQRLGAEDVAIVPCPADGRTRMQAWVMPLAWEAGEAVLRLVEPAQEVLCDRTQEPLSCCMWSEPTPPGGVRGPLAVVDDPSEVSPQAREKLRGAFILTSKPGRGPMKVFAHEVGAAAVVSHHVAHEERHPEAVGWSNGWSDAADGWALKASDCRMTGFQVSPPVGKRLREMLSREPVTCEARVGGRVGEGTLPVVTAVLPGESDEEILLTGHLQEIGADDNASGCGAMMECMRLMASMPRPRRRVRLLLTSECYGSYAFYSQHTDLLPRTVAGANLDCIGETETAERPAQWARSSEAYPSAVDSLFREAMRLTEHLSGALPAQSRTHALSDSAMCDPAAGAPVVCFMKAPWHWHCSLDDWSGIDPRAVRRATVATAAYTRWLAEAGPAEADALAETAAAEALVDAPTGDDLSAQRRAFFTDRARARVLWTRRLGAARTDVIAAKLPALDPATLITDEDGGDDERRTVPARRFWGAPTFDGIPQADRDGFADPRWNMPYVTACYRADGRRSVAEIAALVRTEFGQPMPDLLKFFRVLERGGLVELTRR